jgi:Zn-dependent oligopeptidase
VYPRKQKQGGASVTTMINRNDIQNNSKKSVSYMMANFDESNLLTHSDVETFFHEFGHITHGLCATSNYDRLSGANTERDFVELPSQMLENWVWDRQVLKRLSHHHETG